MVDKVLKLVIPRSKAEPALSEVEGRNLLFDAFTREADFSLALEMTTGEGVVRTLSPLRG